MCVSTRAVVLGVPFFFFLKVGRARGVEGGIERGGKHRFSKGKQSSALNRFLEGTKIVTRHHCCYN